MDERALRAAVKKGDKAAKMVKSQAELWGGLDADLWQLWCGTKSEEKEKREDIYREYHASKALRARLQRIANEGRKAREELEQRKQKHGN